MARNRSSCDGAKRFAVLFVQSFNNRAITLRGSRYLADIVAFFYAHVAGADVVRRHGTTVLRQIAYDRVLLSLDVIELYHISMYYYLHASARSRCAAISFVLSHFNINVIPRLYMFESKKQIQLDKCSDELSRILYVLDEAMRCSTLSLPDLRILQEHPNIIRVAVAMDFSTFRQFQDGYESNIDRFSDDEEILHIAMWQYLGIYKSASLRLQQKRSTLDLARHIQSKTRNRL